MLMSVGLGLLIINGRGITVNDRGSGDAFGKCRGYGRGVSRNASAAGPSGGFICGSSSEVAGHEEVGSPGCPWVVNGCRPWVVDGCPSVARLSMGRRRAARTAHQLHADGFLPETPDNCKWRRQPRSSATW